MHGHLYIIASILSNTATGESGYSCKYLKGFEMAAKFLIGVYCVMLKLKLRKRAKVREMRFEENGGILLVQRPLDSGAQSSNASSKIFNEQEIKNATKGYKETRVLGAGGQGTVDEEILSDGAEVVSKWSRSTFQTW
ncbi:hypothetical protein Bca4012_038880 [Brassica carinata]